ncbi:MULTISPECIES: alpha/beta fold hydrolase [unclassified Mycobacterium]|uniref:alpha/beta fold hydrolase n=1 Tax=unclassified Mycobacterium TaxID=2642494 RepID=UPI0029C7BC24|nr:MULTISPECIES: alpha/beta fold hydrolase [unclassified Mycobacterium]
MITSRFTDSGGARLHFLDSGGSDYGASIVFVPGMTDIADDYAEVLPLLGRRTVVVELRGHGRSSAPVAGYDLATLGSDVGAVVDAVTDGPVHVMTFSRGTSYALAWAIANPRRVRSVSIGDYVPEERVLTGAQTRFLLDGRWRGTLVRDRLDEAGAIAQFNAARTQSFWEPLADLQPPLLVVRARDSPIIGDADWARYRQLFPTAHLHEFPDSPHDIFRPDRGRYPRLVREHVDRIDGR